MTAGAAAVLRGLAGLGAPLIAAGATHAELTGLTIDEQVVSVVDDPVVGTIELTVFTLIADFDAMDDQLTAVAGTPGSPMDITITGGSFWNHPLAGQVAPAASVVDMSPAALYDSFVDIGQEINDGTDPTLTPPGNFPAGLGAGDAGFSVLGAAQDANNNGVPDGEETAWARVPVDPLTVPFDPGTFPGAGQVLIGRFSAAGSGDIFISGTLLVRASGQQTVISFTTIPAPGTLALIGMAALIGRRRARC